MSNSHNARNARYLYSELANLVQARANCNARSLNDENANTWHTWHTRHTERIESLVSERLPHGSGFDWGTRIDLDASHASKLVFATSFHHMDEHGGDDGWTEHVVTVTPAFVGDFHLRISGRNRNDIKELIGQEFEYALHTDLQPYMDWDAAVLAHPSLRLASRWIDVCTQRWEAVIPLRSHTYRPEVGDTVKMGVYQDYGRYNINAWSWLKVERINLDTASTPSFPNVTVQILDGDKPTGRIVTLPLHAFSPPLNWATPWDADEVVTSDHTSWVNARDAAVRILKTRETSTEVSS